MSTAARRTGGVIAVVAHPDGEALIAGGTLALAAAAGVVSLTRGSLGPISDRALADVRTLGVVREHELRASGAILGVDWTFCLEHPDGELPWAHVETAAAVRCVLHRKLAALRAHRTQLDAEHVLSRIGVKLAAHHLGEEAWRAACAEPGEDDVLARLLAAPFAVAGDG